MNETHQFNYCLNCKSRNEKGVDKCPKCGSRRHRAYLKEGEDGK